jgi:hypothetical protein
MKKILIKKICGGSRIPKVYYPRSKEVDNDEKEDSKPNASLLFYHGGLLRQRIFDLLNDNSKIENIAGTIWISETYRIFKFGVKS